METTVGFAENFAAGILTAALSTKETIRSDFRVVSPIMKKQQVNDPLVRFPPFLRNKIADLGNRKRFLLEFRSDILTIRWVCMDWAMIKVSEIYLL